MPKKGQRSRKGKKAWRKNVNVEAETDALSMVNAPNEALFTIDKVKKSQTTTLTKAQRKEAARNKVLSYEKIIPTPQEDEDKGRRVQKTLDKRLASMISKAGEQELEEETITTGPSDPWIAAEERMNAEAKADPYLKITREKEASRGIPPKRVKRKQARILSSQIGQVHPGQSYRPTEDDQQEVLGTALAQLIAIQEEDERIAAQLRAPPEIKNEEAEMQVRTAADYSDDEEEVEEKPLTEEELKRKMIANKYSMRVTRAERNKEKRKKREASQLRKKRREKRQRAELDKIPKYLEKIESHELEMRAKREYIQQKKLEKAEKPQRLGKLKYQEKIVDFQYTDEIPTALRQVSKKGDLFEDVFKDLQRRNLIEPRVKHNLRRRYPVRYVEKQSAKRWKDLA